MKNLDTVYLLYEGDILVHLNDSLVLQVDINTIEDLYIQVFVYC